MRKGWQKRGRFVLGGIKDLLCYYANFNSLDLSLFFCNTLLLSCDSCAVPSLLQYLSVTE